MKISLQNFQSIRRADIEVQGLTVLTGTNNIGKTAIFRAIRALLFNTGKQGFVRAGSKGFTVSVNDDIAYGRDKQNFYEVLGTRFDKVGRNPVSVLIEDFKKVPGFKGFGFLFLEDDGEVVTPQFTFQKETPFPFNLSPGKMYNVFSSFFGTEGIDTLVSEESQKIRDSRAAIAALDTREQQIQKAVNLKTAFTKRFPDAETLGTKRDALAALDSRVSKTKGLWEKHERVSADCRRLQDIVGLEFPDVERLGELVTAVKLGLEALRRHKHVAAELSRVSVVSRCPEVDLESVETLYGDAIRARKALGALRNAEADILRLDALKAVKTPDFEAIEELRELCARTQALTADHRRVVREEKSVTADVLALEKSIIETMDKLKEFDSCPLCGSALK